MRVAPVNMISLLWLCYVAKGRLFWVVLTSSGHPFKNRAEHFLRVVIEEETRHVPAGLEESKLLCCELPGREVVSGCWQAPNDGKRGNRDLSDLSLTTSKSWIWPTTWMSFEVILLPEPPDRNAAWLTPWFQQTLSREFRHPFCGLRPTETVSPTDAGNLWHSGRKQTQCSAYRYQRNTCQILSLTH